MLTGILAVSDPTLPELGSISGGLPFLVRNVLGEKLGVLLLVEVIFAVFVCALAVHAAAVRLMFAMARDRNLPFARSLSHVSPRTRAPAAPAVVIGLLSAAILIVNANLPNVIEMLCSVAVVWANLAYLLVTIPLLVSRLSRRSPATGLAAGASRAYFSLGRFGLPVNALAAVWGLFVVTNMSWPRPEIYGDHTWGQFAAPLATLALVTGGLAYYALYQRKRTGIVPEHAAGESLDQIPLASKNLTIENSVDRPAHFRATRSGATHENQRIGATTDRQTVGYSGQAAGAEAAEARTSPSQETRGSIRAIPGLVCPLLYGTRARCGWADRSAPGPGRPRRVSLVFPADGGSNDRRFDRRLSGSQGENQGGRPELRRPAPG